MAFPGVPRAPVVGAALLLLACLLGVVGLAVPWSHTDDAQRLPPALGVGVGPYEGSLGAFEATLDGESIPYSDPGLDGEPGIGLLRAGGPLLALGVGLAVVAAFLVVLDLLVPERHLDTAALVATNLCLAALVVGTLVLLAGTEDLVASLGATRDGAAGPALLAIAAGDVLGAAATTLAHRLHRPREDADEAGGDPWTVPKDADRGEGDAADADTDTGTDAGTDAGGPVFEDLDDA